MSLASKAFYRIFSRLSFHIFSILNVLGNSIFRLAGSKDALKLPEQKISIVRLQKA